MFHKLKFVLRCQGGRTVTICVTNRKKCANLDHMLPQTQRIQKNKDFEKVFKKGKSVFTKNLSFRFLPNNNADQLSVRFGFIISNKVNKLAVRRNAIKRQLRQICQVLIPEIKQSCDIVIMVKQDFPYPYDQKEIEQQVREGLMKARVLS